MKFLRQHPIIKSLIALSLKTWVLVFSLALACGTLAILAAGFFGLDDDYFHVSGTEYSADRILSIKINGVIVGDSMDGYAEGYGIVSGYAVKQQLYKAAQDSDIRGVVLEIDSPGGTINGAQAITEGVAYYREQTKQPIYAHIGTMGASGGYWSAVSADRVIADYGSEVGSIGVLMGPFKYYDTVVADEVVLTQNGVESTYLTAGKSKDAGDPYRRLTAEEKDTFQRSINNEYDRFVTYVAQRRGITEQTIRDNLGAFTYDTKAALDYKLIDEANGREETYAALAKAAGLGEYDVVRPNVLDETASATSGVVTTVNALLRGRSVASHQTSPEQSQQATACPLLGMRLAYSGDPAKLCK